MSFLLGIDIMEILAEMAIPIPHVHGHARQTSLALRRQILRNI